MNNALKGAIGAAAGVALLLGGAGTFAMWNDSISPHGSTINTGSLSLEAADDGQWYDGATGTAKPIDISTFLMAPNDVIHYTVPLTITAKGTNLTADLTAEVGEFGKDSDGSTELLKSGDDFAVDVDYTTAESTGVSIKDGGDVDTAPGDAAAIAAKAAGTYAVDATVTVHFTDVDEKTDQDLLIPLENIKFKLTQTAPKSS